VALLVEDAILEWARKISQAATFWEPNTLLRGIDCWSYIEDLKPPIAL